MAYIVRGIPHRGAHSSAEGHPFADRMEAAWRLRHRVFVEELGWEAVRRPDGREIDAYDTPDAVHVLVERSGRLAGYARLLPTITPHILADVFPWLCRDKAVPRGANILEWTRQCVAPELRGGHGLSDVHAELILAVLEWCLGHGVDSLTAEGSSDWLGRFDAIGMATEALGAVHAIDGRPVIAMLFRFDGEVLARARRRYGIERSVIEEFAFAQAAA